MPGGDLAVPLLRLDESDGNALWSASRSFSACSLAMRPHRVIPFRVKSGSRNRSSGSLAD